MASSQPNQDEALIDIYRPLIKERLKSREVVKYLVNFLPKETPRALRVIARRGESQAVEKLLNDLIDHKSQGWFSAFTTALEKGGYKYLANLLRRYIDREDDSFHQELINIVLPKLINEIDCNAIMPDLLSSGCITKDDFETIRAEHINNGQRSAALYMILECLPSKSEDWFSKFIVALNKGGYKQLSEEMDPKLGLAENEARVAEIIDGMKEMTLHPKSHAWPKSKPGSDDFQDRARPAPGISEQSVEADSQQIHFLRGKKSGVPNDVDSLIAENLAVSCQRETSASKDCMPPDMIDDDSDSLDEPCSDATTMVKTRIEDLEQQDNPLDKISNIPPAQEPWYCSDEENSSLRFTDDKNDMHFTPEERRDIRHSSCRSSSSCITPDMVPEHRRTGKIASYRAFTASGWPRHEQASDARDDVCIVSHKSCGCSAQVECEEHRCFPPPEVRTFEKLSKEPHEAVGVTFQCKVEDEQPSDLYSPNRFGKCSVCRIERDLVPCRSCRRRRVCHRCIECKTCRRSATANAPKPSSQSATYEPGCPSALHAPSQVRPAFSSSVQDVKPKQASRKTTKSAHSSAAKIAKQTQISELHEKLNIPQQYRPPSASTPVAARPKSKSVSPASTSASKPVKVSPVRQPPPTTLHSKKARKSDGVLVSISQPLQQPKAAPNSTVKTISGPLKPCIVCKCEREMIKCSRCGRKVVCQRCDMCRKCRRS